MNSLFTDLHYKEKLNFFNNFPAECFSSHDAVLLLVAVI
jgi:hypothetical protein